MSEKTIELNGKIVMSSLKSVASQDLQTQVTDELQEEDPENLEDAEKAIAKNVENN